MARLRAFLAAKDRNAARRVVGTIRGSVATLVVHPEIGRPVEEMPSEYREWVVPFGNSSYLVLYRYEGERVALLAVRHGREAGYVGH